MTIKEEIINEWKDRLNTIYNELYYRNVVKDKREFAKILKKPYSNVIQALKGNKRFLTEPFVREICTAPDQIIIDFKWLTSGVGNVMMMIGNKEGGYDPVEVNTASTQDHELINLYRDNKKLQDENRELRDKNSLLSKEISRLNAYIAQLSSGSVEKKSANAG